MNLLKTFCFLLILTLALPTTAQYLKLPRPVPTIHEKIKTKYRGLTKSPKVMRRYMLDYTDEFVRMYMKQFFRDNPWVDKNIFPPVSQLITDNQLVLKSVADRFILEFSKNGAYHQQDQMDKMVMQYVTTNGLKLIQANFKALRDELNGYNKQIARIEKDLQEIQSSGLNNTQNNSELSRIRENLTRLGSQIKKIKTQQLTSGETKTQFLIPSQKGNMIPWAALLFSLISIFMARKKS